MPFMPSSFTQWFCVTLEVEWMFCSSSAVVNLFVIVYLDSPQDTNIFVCAVQFCQKIGFGHIHWENWGLIIKYVKPVVTPIKLLR